MLGLQDVENLRRPFRIGPVVEGQRQLLGHLADAADHIVGRQAAYRFSSTMSPVSLSSSKSRAPGCGSASTRRISPSPSKSTSSIGREWCEACGRGRTVGPAQQRQDGGIFRAQPPQRIARRLIGIGGMDLVEGGHRVQKPDVVLGAVAFVDRRNADCWWRRRTGCRRRNRAPPHRFGKFPAWWPGLALHPVIAIVAQRRRWWNRRADPACACRECARTSPGRRWRLAARNRRASS